MCYEVVFWISISSQIPKIYHQKSMLLISFVFLKNKNEFDPNCSSVSRLISAQPCNVCLYAGRIVKVTPVQTSGHRACVVLGYCQLGAVYINHTVSYFTSSFYLKFLLLLLLFPCYQEDQLYREKACWDSTNACVQLSKKPQLAAHQMYTNLVRAKSQQITATANHQIYNAG